VSLPLYTCGTRAVRTDVAHCFHVVCATCAFIMAEYDSKAAAIRHATNNSDKPCRICGAD
jgi:hypothetical protein